MTWMIYIYIYTHHELDLCHIAVALVCKSARLNEGTLAPLGCYVLTVGLM